MSPGDDGTMGRTEFHALLALAGVALPGETRPTERRRLLDELGLPWLCSELVATDPARARVRAWLEVHGRHAPDDDLARGRLADRVAVVAEAALKPLICATLTRLPALVLDHLQRSAVVFAAGKHCGGLRGSIPEGPVHSLQVLWQGSDDAFRDTLAHEACHSWLDSAPPRRPAERDRDERRRGLRLAVEWGRVDHLARAAAQDEARCVALTHALGFVNDDARCLVNARREVHDAARLEAAQDRDELAGLEAALRDGEAEGAAGT